MRQKSTSPFDTAPEMPDSRELLICVAIGSAALLTAAVSLGALLNSLSYSIWQYFRFSGHFPC